MACLEDCELRFNFDQSNQTDYIKLVTYLKLNLSARLKKNDEEFEEKFN